MAFQIRKEQLTFEAKKEMFRQLQSQLLRGRGKRIVMSASSAWTADEILSHKAKMSTSTYELKFCYSSVRPSCFHSSRLFSS